LGLCPRPRWRSSQRSANPIAGFKGSCFYGKRREGKGKGEWRERKG